MIAAITGLPGEGKTWFAVSLIYKLLKEGRDVYVNFPVTKPEGEEVSGTLRRFDTFQEFIQIREGEIFLDEGQIWMNAREWEHLPKEAQWSLQQHRKRGLNIYCTVQDLSRIELVYRQLVARYFAVSRIWRIIIIREYRPKINADTQMIEKEETLRWWLQWMPVKPLEAFMKLGMVEAVKVGLRPHLMYGTRTEIGQPKDAKPKGGGKG